VLILNVDTHPVPRKYQSAQQAKNVGAASIIQNAFSSKRF
jgi:hypothetical protein